MPGDGTKTGITTSNAVLPRLPIVQNAVESYRMRWKRRRLLWRAFRARRQLQLLRHLAGPLGKDEILLFCVLRNEIERLPHFLEHYRGLGVTRFFFVDNGSHDGSDAYLLEQADCSVWRSNASYKSARFGMDWLNYLLAKYGTGHRCVTVDADEIVAFSSMNRVYFAGLFDWMTASECAALGGLMIELYPRGPVGRSEFRAGGNPLDVLTHFDGGPYRATRQRPLLNLWVQGGVRERVFFKNAPKRSPTLNKIPLVRWKRGYVYVNSTHSMLPRHLNSAFIDEKGALRASLALLHTKFLPSVVAKSQEEKTRGEHFTNSAAFDAYYDAVSHDPDLWTETSLAYDGPDQLEALGLIKAGDWV